MADEIKKRLPELNYNPGMTADQILESQDPVVQPSNGEVYDHALGLPDKSNFQPPAPTGEGPSKWDQIVAYMQPKLAGLTKPIPNSEAPVSQDAPDAHSTIGDILRNGWSQGAKADDAVPPPQPEETGIGAARGVVSGASGDTGMPDVSDDDKSAAVQKFIEQQKQDPKSYGFKTDRDDAALTSAIQARREDEAHNNLGRAFNTMSAGIGNQKVDNSFYDTLDKQSGQRVADIDALRKGQAGESDFAQKQKLEDPTAPENQAFRSALFSAMPTLQKMPGVENITLANPGPFEKLADAYQRAEATKAVNENNRMMKQAQMDALGQERNRKEADMTASKLRGDKEYQAALAGEDSAKNALDSLDLARTNPIAFGSKAIETARSIVGGGRINVQEIQQLGGSQAIMDRIEQMAQTAKSGTITPANYQFYKQLIQLSLKNAQEHKAKAIDTYVNAYARRNNKPHDEAYTDLIGKPPEAPGTGLDKNDPRVQKALAAGYSPEEIASHLSKK